MLIFGRDNEIDSQEKKDMFVQSKSDKINVINYDTLKRRYDEHPRVYKNVICETKNGYILKILKTRFPLRDFSTNNLFFSKKIEAQLIKQGEMMERWKKGKPIPMYGVPFLGENYDD